MKFGRNLLIPLVLSASSPITNQAVIRTTLDQGGRFWLLAKVSDSKVSMPLVVDTGANATAFPQGAAALLGLKPESLPSMDTDTANGSSTIKVFNLDSLQIGPCVVRNIQAAFVDGLPVPLLGIDVLKQMDAVEIHGDDMTVRCTAPASPEPSRPATVAAAPAPANSHNPS